MYGAGLRSASPPQVRPGLPLPKTPLPCRARTKPMPRSSPRPEGLRLDESHAGLEAQGYANDFRTSPGGRVTCTACGMTSPASQFDVAAQKRIEGVSDPDDESLVVALACPACHAKGTLTLAYGPRAGIEDSQALADLPPPRVPAKARSRQSTAGEDSRRPPGRTGRRKRPAKP